MHDAFRRWTTTLGVESALTIMTNSSPFPAAVATHPWFSEWVVDLIDSRSPTSRDDFMHVLESTFLETLHSIAATRTLDNDSRVRPHEFFRVLMVGPDVDALVAYMDGAAGKDVPPGPRG